MNPNPDSAMSSDPQTPPAPAAAPAHAPEAKLAVNIDVAAQMMSCSASTIRKFIRQRKLPRLLNFRHILIPVAALERFVKESSKAV